MAPGDQGTTAVGNYVALLWFRQGLIAYSAPSHCQNQNCLLEVILIKNKINYNFDSFIKQNEVFSFTKIFVNTLSVMVSHVSSCLNVVTIKRMKSEYFLLPSNQAWRVSISIYKANKAWLTLITQGTNISSPQIKHFDISTRLAIMILSSYTIAIETNFAQFIK